MNSQPSSHTVRTNHLLAAVRLFLCVCWTVCLGPWLILGVSLNPVRRSRIRQAARLVHWWGAGLTVLAGIATRIEGEKPSPAALLASNHVSHLDIPLIASATPTLFLSKREIADWFFLGFLLRRTENPLTSRLTSKEILNTVEEIRERLTVGRRVTVFLEGTTTAGDRVLKFFPSLVQPAISAETPLVPVAIRWSVTDPRLSVREDVAYWGGHRFLPHLWRVLGIRGIQAHLVFEKPIDATGRHRRELAQEARVRIVQRLGLENAPDTPEREAGTDW